jgi:hypothetical protein
MLVRHSQFFKHSLIVLFFVALTACANTKSTQVSHLLAPADAKVFKIASIDESGNEINDRLILEALQQNISKLSLYPNFYSAIDDLTENISGFEAIISTNNIKVQYMNGQLAPNGNHHLAKVSAIFKVEFKKDDYGLYKTITVHQPKSLHISPAKSPYSNINTLDTPDKLRKDVEHIFSNIKLTMERLLFISGEIIVRNSDDEVYDNFEHKLGLYSKNSFQEKGMIFGIFELKSNSRKEIIPVRVRIYPNAKGSRVKYEFDIKYLLNSDGTTTYNTEEISYLVTTIKNISTTKDLDAPINHQKVNNKNLIAIIDDPVMISDYNKPVNPIDIHKTSITYRRSETKPKSDSKPKSTSKNSNKKKSTQYKSKQTVSPPKTRSIGKDHKPEQAAFSGPKSNNIKNVEYIEKMLSSLKEKRPSK